MSVFTTFFRLIAAATLCFAAPTSAQEVATSPVSAGSLAAKPTPFLLHHFASTDLTFDSPTAAAHSIGLVPRPGLGTGIGVISGAAVGGVYAWGLAGKGWLGHSDTPKMILAGAVTGAIVGYTADFIVSRLRD